MSNDNYHNESQNEEFSSAEPEIVEVDQGEEPVLESGMQDSGQTEKRELEEKVLALELKLAEANDQYLRKAAEFENFRKRMNREKQEVVDFANQNLLLDLIQVIDDFERAIKSAETSKDFTGFYEGISMIEKRLSSQLEIKWGLKRFDSGGEVFDPNRHEAIMMEKSADITEPVVREDFIKGYTLKDRVIRSAKVKVIMPENSGTGNGEPETPAEGETESGSKP